MKKRPAHFAFAFLLAISAHAQQADQVAPMVRSGSRVTITLTRRGCLGSCPSYTVTVSTDGIVFEGHTFVVAPGKHTDKVAATEVRQLAQRFVRANFYSMESKYDFGIADNPTSTLSIAIDGYKKDVEDDVSGSLAASRPTGVNFPEGIPAALTQLENSVDTLAGTQRWVSGSEGLVRSLQAEKFKFRTFEAQAMVKEAASRGQVSTVREFFKAGVPLNPLAVSTREAPDGTGLADSLRGFRIEDAGWLQVAAGNPDALQTFIEIGAGKNDQNDKNQALAAAVREDNVRSAQLLLAYNADPNTNLRTKKILLYAAERRNPRMVATILRYRPNLEARDVRGRTAMFASDEYGQGEDFQDTDGADVQIVRLLSDAGADVNARDANGDTPLHATVLSDVTEELLKRGADVNARNNRGQTPIFTAVNAAIPILLAHGADLTVRDATGRSAKEAVNTRASIDPALRSAIEKLNQR